MVNQKGQGDDFTLPDFFGNKNYPLSLSKHRDFSAPISLPLTDARGGSPLKLPQLAVTNGSTASVAWPLEVLGITTGKRHISPDSAEVFFKESRLMPKGLGFILTNINDFPVFFSQTLNINHLIVIIKTND